jgi:hypothetical protein
MPHLGNVLIFYKMNCPWSIFGRFSKDIEIIFYCVAEKNWLVHGRWGNSIQFKVYWLPNMGYDLTCHLLCMTWEGLCAGCIERSRIGLGSQGVWQCWPCENLELSGWMAKCSNDKFGPIWLRWPIDLGRPTLSPSEGGKWGKGTYQSHADSWIRTWYLLTAGLLGPRDC